MSQVPAEYAIRFLIAETIETEAKTRNSIRINRGIDVISDEAFETCIRTAQDLRRGKKVVENYAFPLVIRDCICSIGQRFRLSLDEIDTLIERILL